MLPALSIYLRICQARLPEVMGLAVSVAIIVTVAMVIAVVPFCHHFFGSLWLTAADRTHHCAVSLTGRGDDPLR
eukprot:scaffold500763_cov45-Prasinocladus_malaysianus.AAC.1